MTNTPAPWLPTFLQRRTSVSRLFSKEQPAWALYAAEFRRNNRTSFELLNEANYFHMHPFGNRTRMQRLISLGNDSQRKQLCDWLKQKVEEQTGESVSAIRIIAYRYALAKSPSPHAYRQPDPSTVQEADRRVIVTCEYSKKP